LYHPVSLDWLFCHISFWIFRKRLFLGLLRTAVLIVRLRQTHTTTQWAAAVTDRWGSWANVASDSLTFARQHYLGTTTLENTQGLFLFANERIFL